MSLDQLQVPVQMLVNLNLYVNRRIFQLCILFLSRSILFLWSKLNLQNNLTALFYENMKLIFAQSLRTNEELCQLQHEKNS